MNIRTVAAALAVALMAGACDLPEEVHATVDEPAGESPGQPAGDGEAALARPPTSPPTTALHKVLPDGTIVMPDGRTVSVTPHHAGDSLEEIATRVELTVLVRATDNAWSETASGSAPRDGWAAGAHGMGGTMPDHIWREVEVIEVLSGSYDHATLNYGDLFDRTRAGETYLLLVSVLKGWNREGPRYSDQHFTGPAQPFRLTRDDILDSTHPTNYTLDDTLTLRDARARLGD